MQVDFTRRAIAQRIRVGRHAVTGRVTLEIALLVTDDGPGRGEQLCMLFSLPQYFQVITALLNGLPKIRDWLAGHHPQGPLPQSAEKDMEEWLACSPLRAE